MKLVIDLDSPDDVQGAVKYFEGLSETKPTPINTVVPETNTAAIEGTKAHEVAEKQLLEIPDEVKGKTDKHGRKWDARIDSSNLKQTEADEWNARRKPKDMDTIQWNQFRKQVIDSLAAGEAPETTPDVEIDALAGIFPDSDEDVIEPETTTTEAMTGEECQSICMDRIMDGELPDFTVAFVTAQCQVMGHNTLMDACKDPSAVETLRITLKL